MFHIKRAISVIKKVEKCHFEPRITNAICGKLVSCFNSYATFSLKTYSGKQ